MSALKDWRQDNGLEIGIILPFRQNYSHLTKSGLLQKPVLDVAVLFQNQHKAHRDALVATIEKLGGKPAMAMSGAEYLKSSKLNVAAIKSPGDVLMLAMQRVAARYTSRAVVVAIPSTNTVPAPSIVACWDGAPAVKPDSTIRLH